MGNLTEEVYREIRTEALEKRHHEMGGVNAFTAHG